MPSQLVLTTASTITCAPDAAATHGGTVKAASTAKLRVDASRVIPNGIGPNGLSSIASCKTPTASSPPTKKCLLVVSIVPTSVAAKLTVNGIGVLLASLTGVTDGLVGVAPGSLDATANQSRLTAI